MIKDILKPKTENDILKTIDDFSLSQLSKFDIDHFIRKLKVDRSQLELCLKIVNRVEENLNEKKMSQKPNKVFSEGLRSQDRVLMRDGIERGATNIHIQGWRVIAYCSTYKWFDEPDFELLEMVMKRREELSE